MRLKRVKIRWNKDMQRIDLTPAYVLHTRPFRNTSLIVDFFCEEYGRVTAVARSARGPKSRYKGQLQPFSRMLISWSGSRELKTLGQMELNSAPLYLHDQALFCGFYLNELLLKMTQREDPFPQLFELYHRTLVALAGHTQIESSLRLFEKRLLEVLGYGLPLTHEAKTGQPIVADQYYRFVIDQGLFHMPTESVGDDVSVFFGADLISISKESFSDVGVLTAAKRLLRPVLTAMLAGRTINSRELFV